MRRAVHSPAARPASGHRGRHGYHSETAYAYCNYQDIAVGGGFRANNVDITFSEPYDDYGWQAHADGGLVGGVVFAYVMCLHVQS